MIITHSIWLTTKTRKLLLGKRLVKKETIESFKTKLSKEVVGEIKRHLDVKNRTLSRQMNMKINKKYVR